MLAFLQKSQHSRRLQELKKAYVQKSDIFLAALETCNKTSLYYEECLTRHQKAYTEWLEAVNNTANTDAKIATCLEYYQVVRSEMLRAKLASERAITDAKEKFDDQFLAMSEYSNYIESVRHNPEYWTQPPKQ